MSVSLVLILRQTEHLAYWHYGVKAIQNTLEVPVCVLPMYKCYRRTAIN